ncbi:MAG: hypothetical protein HYS12_18205 [Planctomycetes bacterium]|nr:hypothetical protein [Planctomycetota bacterium]
MPGTATASVPLRPVDLAPQQSDETLLKRAAYHYRQDLPETFGQVYRDAAPG